MTARKSRDKRYTAVIHGRLEPDVKKRLVDHAEATGIAEAVHIRLAINQYLEREFTEPKKKKAG